MRSFEFPIEAGHIQEFKRAVGDLDAAFDLRRGCPAHVHGGRRPL